MPTCESTWEDEDHNRHVELNVEFQVDDGQINIGHVTPQRVHIFHPSSSRLDRTLRVCTDGGRQLLARRASEAGHLEQLARQIQDGQTVELPAAGQVQSQVAEISPTRA